MNVEQRKFLQLALSTASLCLGAMLFHLLELTLVSNVFALLALVSCWQLWLNRPQQEKPANKASEQNES